MRYKENKIFKSITVNKLHSLQTQAWMKGIIGISH